MTDLAELIKDVGFPIGMCVILFIYMEQESKNHKEEVKGLQDVLTELRVSIVKLTDNIMGGGKES